MSPRQMSLPSFSVRNSVLVNMLMLVLLASGFVFAFTLQREMFPESRPDKLLISAANNRVPPLHPPGYDFYEILRSKLFWGRDSRKRKT